MNLSFIHALTGVTVFLIYDRKKEKVFNITQQHFSSIYILENAVYSQNFCFFVLLSDYSFV